MNPPSSGLFLSACGSDEPLRVGVSPNDDMRPESWTFAQPFLVIGRRPESDLMLDHWQVSRRHAYLQLIEGRFYCVDLGSRTGTHGGDASDRSGWLEGARAIRIGPFSVHPECPTRALRETPTLPGVTWELPGRALGQATWRMDRNLALVGRSPACRIRMIEADVSKYHCSLVLTRLGVWVVDLLSQKGVIVNGEAVRFARLDDGDELLIGRHSLRPRYDTAPPALPSPAFEGPDLPSPRQELTTELATRPPFPGGIMAAGRPAWPAGPLAEPSAALMLHQMGLMQQQMFDQFHQTMMMMFEGFAALHRETSGAIREEMEQVRNLTREIEELRGETARIAEATSRPPATPPPVGNGHAPPDRVPGPPPAPTPAPAPAGPVKRPQAPPPGPGVDIHSQLLKRLSTIESERQNRWRKILGIMSNRS